MKNHGGWNWQRPGIFATSFLSILIRMVHRPVRVESLEEHEHERSCIEEVGQNRDQPAKLHLMKVMIAILILSSMMLLKMTKSLFTKSWLSAALAPAMTQSWAQTRAISMFIWITWPRIVMMKDGFSRECFCQFWECLYPGWVEDPQDPEENQGDHDKHNQCRGCWRYEQML